MSAPRLRFAALLVLGGLTAASTTRAEERTADKILAEINAIEMPKIPADRTDQAAVQDYILKRQQAFQKKADLTGELFKANPDQPELVTLLPQRWQFFPANHESVKAEVAQILANSKDQKLIAEASYYQLTMAIQSADPKAKPGDLLAKFDAFAEKFPKDLRIPTVLLMVANHTSDAEAQEAIFKRIEKDYPRSVAARQLPFARKKAESDREKLARVGKPFELEFTEAIKGTPITMASLKGKVVVVNFWATWCGPCVAEMPKMKKLYAEFKDKGVEFIGVSLDQPKEKGGLDKLKEFVAKNEIGWPQYYQGNFWQSEFSSSWGINSIPCVFLIDAEGKLAEIEARGKLEELIPKYLEKAKAGTSKTAATP